MDYNKLLEKARKMYAECVTGAEKRRLESIFPELAECEDEKVKRGIIKFLKENKDFPEDWVAWLEKQGEKKPAKRSDEEFDDFFNLESVIDIVEMYGKGEVRLYGDDITSELEWLKSLRDRLQPQPKQEWSEEDEKMLNQVKQSLYRYQDHLIGSPLADDVKMEINWLKSLKPQPHWKPTDEQMQSLYFAIITYSKKDDCKFTYDGLNSLYDDLKKF